MSDQASVPTILIVEDQPANMLLARAALQRGGYQTLEAADADEARACLEETRPDLILMDIGLPGQDGLSLTRELKDAPETADIPIVVLTAHAMRADEERARAAGCDGYLAKPFSPRELVAKVAELLETAAARRSPETPGS
ncbi:MAG TPA: response regulator [Thermomicrobiales bacterium]|nr:response regulator [Thermomicrobiales bacterium]